VQSRGPAAQQPTADEAAHADDFASAHREGDVGEDAVEREMLDPQRFLAKARPLAAAE
jgi:hypothetical protein